MRFHIPGIPHTRADDAHCGCAYSKKATRLASVLMELGHETYFYACEGAEVRATEYVPVVTDEYRRLFYLQNDDPRNQYIFNTGDEYHQTYYRRCVEEISKRLAENDLLLLPWGFGHKPIADMLGDKVIPVESGIGYPDCFCENRVFESECWRAWVQGKEGVHDVTYKWAVIPNFYYPDEFRYQGDKEDWFLYLGRLVKRKGIHTTVEATRQAGVKLVIAGQGEMITPEGIDLRSDHVEFVGFAGPEKKKDLMARAKGFITLTEYTEPFGGAPSAEAPFSGTPVIVTDWGVYPETVINGVTGWRCSTLAEEVWAINHISDIRPQDCRDWAMNCFSAEKVGPLYVAYFERLLDLKKDTYVSYRTRRYPGGACQ
jgi:glycosyltransferase involved in cell wall biosynthesis